MRQRCKTPVLSKKHYQDLVGKKTPGAGAYDTCTFTEEGPKYSVTKNERFKVPPKATKLAAHAYYTPCQYMLGIRFTSDTRWKYERDDKTREARAPAPDKYTL